MDSNISKLKKEKLYEQNKRIGVEPFRSYYIPFRKEESFSFAKGILERESSDLYLSLDGEWLFKDFESLKDLNSVDEFLDKKIDVPSCVQIKGFDSNQYVNYKYNFAYNPPYIDRDIPCFHYRRSFVINDSSKIPYLCFDGVDSCFYLFINNEFVGFSQISHSLSEFNIKNYVHDGENIVDVIVLKWCASSYIEDQDKFRFSGIFRSCYILLREEQHIEDFKISTSVKNGDGYLTIKNIRGSSFNVAFNKEIKTIQPGTEEFFVIKHVKIWSDKHPKLYDVVLSTKNEKILQRIGFRNICIDNGIFKINDKHQKLYGVNRHEFSPETGATLTREFTFNDLLLIKSLGVNAIRTSHYPDMPEFYELCNYLGLYIVDEADIESHGAVTVNGGYDLAPWEELANSGIYDDAILDREKSLYERDKNQTCVVIWSLGNESSYGKMFYDGADYIHEHDSRPIHYEGLWNLADKSINGDYYTKRVDIVSRMYPPYEWLEHGYLDDKNEKRPLMLCEYCHAMGNSSGDLVDYWRVLSNNDRFVGAFVWEWNDHAINVDGKLLYGGDFKEELHDGNFCVDGLVTPYRKLKSSTKEMEAIYKGKLYPDREINKCKKLKKISAKHPLIVEFNQETGALTKIIKNDNNILTSPIEISFLRAFIDNDMPVKWKLEPLRSIKPTIIDFCIENNTYIFKGKLEDKDKKEIFSYSLIYEVFDEAVDISLSYSINPEINYIPRFGVKFAVSNKNDSMTYFGYGPDESYIDKRIHNTIKKFNISVEDNFYSYIRPQETGSHYYSSFVETKELKVLAEKPFSFSVLPYSVEQLIDAKHNFELKETGNTYICLDIFLSGVGSNSCGPEIKKEYTLPKKGSNKFRLILK